jgi:NADPH:quinone reductase-like Zn-dependent oxidoreductase
MTGVFVSRREAAMKAIVYTEYGSPDVLRLQDVERPTPKDDEVLLAVRAASMNPLDRHFMRGPYIARIMTGLRRPKHTSLGADVAGRVEAVGRSVSELKPGDEVFGVCTGAFAEYACTKESSVVIKPANITFEQAASAPVAGLTALQGLRDKARVRPGQKVLINGAAGGVGTFAVQIAKSLGAEVTGVCSTPNVELVRSIGADRVIDYTRDDFTRGEQRYDLMFDCIGNRSLRDCRRVLRPKGMYLIVGGRVRRGMDPLPHMIGTMLTSLFISQNTSVLLAKQNRDDLLVLRELMAGGKVRPVIDRRYPLAGTAEAMCYLEEGHARGKIVITPEGRS